MKKLALLLWCLPFCGYAQKTYTLVYDYLDNKLIEYSDGTTVTKIKDDHLSGLHLKSGDNIIVSIPHINTYLYSINVTVENQSFNNTPPKLLAGLFTDFDPSTLILKGTPAPTLTQSQHLATDVEKVNKKFKPFRDRALGMSYRYFSATTTEAELVTALSANAATILADMNAAQTEIDAIQGKYLAYKAAATSVDDSKMLDEIYANFLAKNFDKLLAGLVQQQINLRPEQFQYKTAPVTATGENVHITISIALIPTDSDTKNAAINATTIREYDLPVRGLTHWSFSTGFFGASTTTTSYVAQSVLASNSGGVDTVAGYKNIIDDRRQLAIGANALIHYTYKITPGFEFGGHFGLGVPINTSYKMHYLLGLSFMLFDQNRLGLNVGLAGTYVSTLSPNVSINKQYKVAGSVPITYIDKFRYDILQVSITYNLSGLLASNKK